MAKSRGDEGVIAFFYSELRRLPIPFTKRDFSVDCFAMPFYLMLLLALAPALAAPKKQTAPVASWKPTMRDLERNLLELLSYTSSDARYEDPKNKSKIDQAAERFAKSAQTLSHQGASHASQDADPTLPIVARLFAQQAKQAQVHLKWKNREYARSLLNSMTSYCVACHTRNSSGVQFHSLSDPPEVKSLGLIDRAQYFSATRQFDRAIETYQAYLSDPPAHRPWEFEKAVRSALSIALRVKTVPASLDLALELIKKADNPKAAEPFRALLGSWKEELNSWKKDPPRAVKTPEERMKEIERLYQNAKQAQKYPLDRSADVLFLRTTQAIHDFLATPESLKSKYRSEALYKASLCYEVLKDLHLWDLYEFYDLQCILESPGTPIAEKCYQHYRESLYASYTGTRGTDLPEEVRKHINDVEKIAKPPKSPPPATSVELQ